MPGVTPFVSGIFDFPIFDNSNYIYSKSTDHLLIRETLTAEKIPKNVVYGWTGTLANFGLKSF